MVAINKKDIKNASFIFGKYEAIPLVSGALVPAGQDNVWEHLGIPLSFEETTSADIIERRNIATVDLAELQSINNNMLGVSFEFNIPKISGTSASILGFDLTRWLDGEATKTSHGFGESTTDSTSGELFSLTITDDTNTIVYREGRLTSISISFDDGLFTVTGDAMFIGTNKTIVTSFTEQIEPVVDSGSIVNGPSYSVPLTNLDSSQATLDVGGTKTATNIRNMSVSRTYNTEWVKALGSKGVIDIVKTTNSALTGSFEVQDIKTLANTGFIAQIKTAFDSDTSKFQFEFYKGGSSTAKNRGFILVDPIILSEVKDSYTESDFATRSFSFSAIKASIADATL